MAWLATNTSSSLVSQLMRVAWRTVGRILMRTVASVNATIRLIQHRFFGFHHPRALIALAMLTLSGFRPARP